MSRIPTLKTTNNENTVIIKTSEHNNMVKYQLLGEKNQVLAQVKKLISQFPPFGYGTMEHLEQRRQLSHDLFITEISRYKTAD